MHNINHILKCMKNKLFILVVLLFTFAFNSTVYATTNNQDGLTVNITTDKESYNAGEDISAELEIINNNETTVTITNAEIIMPDGFELQKDSSSSLTNQKIEPNESLQLQTKLKKKSTVETASVINQNENQGQSKEHKNIIANTSKFNQSQQLLLLLGFGGMIAYIIFTDKKNRTKKSLLIFIIFSLCSANSFTQANAEEVSNQIDTEITVTYNHKDVNIKGKVSYEFETQEPKDPIVYQDGVNETYLDYELNEEQKQITILDKEKVSNWSVGEFHVLKSNVNECDDIAIKIDSIKTLEDGTVLITYTEPMIGEVVKSANYSGTNSQNGRIIPAEGVTLIEDGTDQRERAIQPFGLDVDEVGSINLFKTYKYKKNFGGMEITGKLSLERIKYAFDLETHWFNVDLKRVSVVLDSNLKLNVDAGNNFDSEKKINLASFEAPLGYGFMAVGDIYARISASGEITLEYTIDVESGFDYQNGSFKGILEIDHKLTKAKADVNLQVAASAEPKITLLKMGLVGGEFVYGRNFELSLDNISASPIEYCLDAGYHNFAEVSSLFFPGSRIEQKFTANLMDKENNSTKRYLHIEETGTVDECTRKFGSLDGTVYKQDGEEKLPLYLAEVTLEKNGKVIHQIKTDTKGEFHFAKEIEKGTYDVFVKSNQYETYKSTIKIIGNKKNATGDIVLLPKAETVLVSGKVYDENSLEPIANASLSVKGYEDYTAITDYDGSYSLEVPKGSKEIIANAKGYAAKSIVQEFNSNIDQIDFALTRAYDYEVLTINAGESYEFDYTASSKIFFRADNATEYSSYTNGDATYHKTDYIGEFYVPGDAGSHMEIKVYSGSFTVFVSEDFDTEPIADLSTVCTYESLNGVDPFIDYTISAGQSLTFDNQINESKNQSYKVYMESNDAVGTETVTDYYYNTNMGWESTENVYDINGVIQQWRPLNCLEKVRVSITSGEVKAYYYRLDPITVY